jgi:hypothetical protein
MGRIPFSYLTSVSMAETIDYRPGLRRLAGGSLCRRIGAGSSLTSGIGNLYFQYGAVPLI